MMRSRQDLAELQRRVTESYRRSRAPMREAAGGGGCASPVGSAAYGRVTGVVGSDPDYGPHLILTLQGFTGAPPTPSDVGDNDVRCYPSPGRAVNDYAVDEIVRLVSARGAFFAEKLA